MELIGLFLIASGLLVLAGVAKALRPQDTARALFDLLPARVSRFATLRSTRALVRTTATAEAALGVWALAMPRPLCAALVACSYALFGLVVIYVRQRGGALSTCGCFGRPDTPATWLHLVLDLLFAGAAVTVALRAPSAGSTVTLLSHQPWAGVPLLFVSGVGLYLSYLTLSSLAALEGARRLVRPRATGAASP